MQNHGGYAMSYTNFSQEIYVTNMNGIYPKANRYLSLVKRSDEAFQELVDYFSNVSEPTIICMFGDHLPPLKMDFMKNCSAPVSISWPRNSNSFVTPHHLWSGQIMIFRKRHWIRSVQTICLHWYFRLPDFHWRSTIVIWPPCIRSFLSLTRLVMWMQITITIRIPKAANTMTCSISTIALYTIHWLTGITVIPLSFSWISNFLLC